jgi:hypothetical protein
MKCKMHLAFGGEYRWKINLGMIVLSNKLVMAGNWYVRIGAFRSTCSSSNY